MDTNHQISFRAHLIYANNDTLQLRQEHISFEYPTVGQISQYKYHFNFPVISTSLPTNYEASDLSVEVVDQINENRFIIKEHLLQSPNHLGFYGHFAL